MNMKQSKPLWCKVFGHKYIVHIKTRLWGSMITLTSKLEYPVCKRCGERM